MARQSTGEVNIPEATGKARLHGARNYIFECDWLIELSDSKLSDPITNCPIR